MLRVRTAWTGATTGPGLSTMYFEGETGGAAEDAAAAVATFWGSFEDVMVNYATWRVEGEVAQINPGSGQLEGVFPVVGATGTGNSAISQLPLATQGLLQLRTGSIVGGREIRGRLYIPGPTEAFSDVGRPTSTYITDINSAATALIADSAAWGVWSRRTGGFATITSATTWSEWAVMRSRRD